jgi:DNA-binding transcriptional LysR family regulator
MEYHQLHYFLHAAETLNFTRAAELANVTQPALSRQIAALEAELGVALFDRIRKRVHLTDAGRFFLPKARQILCDTETAAQQTREQFGGAARTLRLGFLSIFLDDLIAPALREFRQRHPKARISLFELTPRAQLDRLRNHELDMAILGNVEQEDKAEFKHRLLARHPMAAVLPEDHPLTKRKSVHLSELSSAQWISLADTFFPGRRDFMQRICQAVGFSPSIALEVDSLSMVLGAVSSGEGIALLPLHAQKLPHTGCVFVSLKSPTPHTELLLLTPKQHNTAEAQTLTELISDRAKSLS